MTNLPRRHIEPLAPAPESFDKVFASARRRRRRKLAAASATMVLALVAAGSFALGASLHVSHRLDPAGHSTGDTSRSAGLPQPTPPAATPSKPSGSANANTNSAPITWLHGRAVDASGDGIAGLWVQPGRADQPTFISGGQAPVRTDARGYFKIVCPHAPVLLSTWLINHDYGDNTAGKTWGATFVGSTNGAQVAPKCGPATVKTTLSVGATVTGQMVAYGTCVPDDAYDIWLWIGGNHDTTIRLAAVHDRDTFTYSGLPAGTYTLGVRHQRKPVPVASGAAVQADADYQCDGTTAVPSGTSDMSSPPPAEQPEEGGTPSPTPAPTIG
jgi:hypothetical protein